MAIWNNKEHRSILEDAEDLAHPPAPSPWTKWFMGCFVAGALAAYAINGWVRGSITGYVLKGPSVTIVGSDVRLFAATYLSLAAFIHFHCFWSLHPLLAKYARPLKVVALMMLCPCLLAICWRSLKPWIHMAH